MQSTVPRSVTPGLRSFCGSLAPAPPKLVRCKPDRDAQPSACFDNVARKVQRAGGSLVTGWAVWTVPGFYYEAEHHGVWCNRLRELVDVSPQPGSPKHILFVRDDEAAYDPLVLRSNVLKAASDEPKAIEFVNLANRRNAIRDAYRQGGNRVALLTLSDQRELGGIEARLLELWSSLGR